MRPNNLENKTLSGSHSLEPPLEYNQGQTLLMNQGSLWLFLTILGVIEILCSFRLVLEGKQVKRYPVQGKDISAHISIPETCFNLTFYLEIYNLQQLPNKTPWQYLHFVWQISLNVLNAWLSSAFFFHLIHSKQGCPVTKKYGLKTITIKT